MAKEFRAITQDRTEYYSILTKQKRKTSSSNGKRVSCLNPGSNFLHNGGVTRASVHKSIDKKPDIIIHLNPAKEDAAKTVLWGKFLSMLPENPGAVGKKYLPLGKESRDNTASETSSARPGMCARIHPGRDRDRWSGRHQIRKTRRVETVTTLLHIQLALRPEQLSTHKYVCVSATRSGKAR